MAAAAILTFGKFAFLDNTVRSISDSQQHSHPNLVRIGLIVKKWQQLFGIQDGSRRHIEFY